MFFRKKKKRKNGGTLFGKIDNEKGRAEHRAFAATPKETLENLRMCKICMAVLVPPSALLTFRFPDWKSAALAGSLAVLSAVAMAATRKFEWKMLPVPAVCIATGCAIGHAAVYLLEKGV